MDEVINEMGLKIRYTNQEKHVPEADRNNRLIKDRYRIAYYWFPYKKIPSNMIHRLEMNARLNLYVFSSKEGLLTHYIPHLILSQKNWDY